MKALRSFLAFLILAVIAIVSLAGRFLIVADTSHRADAIVVIGGDHKRQRMQQAVDLFRQGQAPILIISSGTSVREGLETLPEEEVMRRQAAALGIPDDAVIIENQSMSTYENAHCTKNLLVNRKLKSIILVTSAYHSRRARRIFRDVFGTDVHVSVRPAQPVKHPLLWMFHADERQVVQYEYRNWIRYWEDVLTDRVPTNLACSSTANKTLNPVLSLGE